MPAREKKKRAKAVPFPGRDEILEFMRLHPGKAGTREIARAFGLKNEARRELRQMLRALKEEGAIDRLHPGKETAAAALPRIGVLDIFGRDEHGGLVARPVAWDETLDGPRPTIRLRPGRGKTGISAGVGDRILARIDHAADEDGLLTARPVRRIGRREEKLLGVVRKKGNELLLEPIRRGLPLVEIDPRHAGNATDGDLAEYELEGPRYGPKRGRILRVISNVASEKALSLIAIHAHGIRHEFPPAVLAEAKAMRPVGANSGHEDWTTIPFVTIDPADAKDHDDAVHAATDPEREGGFIATVAIADVAWYVRPGSPLDEEARLRGNSVYFPDRVVPMLPERISNDLCSLRENEIRPALAVRMWFSSDGRKLRHEFHRILMRSVARLSYSQTQAAIDGKPDARTEPLLEPILRPLWQAWRTVNRARKSRAPLDLDLPERRFVLDSEGRVIRVETPERLESHRLIEEFMIQANVCAAETLEGRKQKLVYRVHDAPSHAKLEALREFLKSMNLSLMRAENIRASHFNSILNSVSGTEREDLVNQIVLRSQSQAEYSPTNIGHFGLNLSRYAHFTSPIRRYADLIVHRALIAALGLGEGGITAEQEERLEEIAADISVAERRAMTAERETADRLIAAWLAERIGARFAGRINGVTRSGLFVTLDETGADGFVPISTLSNEYFRFDEAMHALIGSSTGLTYQLGQEVEVELVEVMPAAGALRFRMISSGRPRESKTRRPTRRGAGVIRRTGRRKSKGRKNA